MVGTDGSAARQVTLERDSSVSLGVPIWSPEGSQIVFIRADPTNTAEWLVNADGSGLRMLLPQGASAAWSLDGKWIYYSRTQNNASCISRIPAGGGAPLDVRCDDGLSPARPARTPALYYARWPEAGATSSDWEVRKADQETGPSRVLARIAASRVPFDPILMQVVLSPDEKTLATPLTDRGTTNLWLLPADGGPMRQNTDFGNRSILITRRISWSPDSKYLYAAVNESDADVVLFDGLLR